MNYKIEISCRDLQPKYLQYTLEELRDEIKRIVKSELFLQIDHIIVTSTR